jgi:hypothetical protein
MLCGRVDLGDHEQNLGEKQLIEIFAEPDVDGALSEQNGYRRSTDLYGDRFRPWAFGRGHYL